MMLRMAKRSGPRSRDPWNIGLIAVAIAALAFAGYAGVSAATRDDPANYASTYAAPADDGGPARVAVIGDSYTFGSPEGGNGSNSWVRLLASRLNAEGAPIQLTFNAFGGAGYTRANNDGQTMLSVSDQNVSADTELIVFFGSRNDQESNPEEIRVAARGAMGRAREAAPDAKMIVIGPPWVSENVPADMLANRDAVRAAALDAAADFIDPLDEGWFFGDKSSLIGTDGVHPTNEGHVYMADLMEPRINAALGVPSAG